MIWTPSTDNFQEGLAEQFPVRVEILAVIDTVAAMGLGHVRLNPFE